LTADGLATLAGWPGDHRAAGWRTARGRTGHAGDIDRPFELASVTKLLTTAAVLVAAQEEILSLDEPAGPPGSTVRLLLCHASGLPFEGLEPIAPPGRRRIYGNAAFDALGALLIARAEADLAAYVGDGVLRPLGMGSTTVTGSAAHGARSTVSDLLRFADELLQPGVVLAPEVLADATTVQLPDLAGVVPGFGSHAPNPWGLGFEIRGHKAPHWTPPGASPGTFGHFGQSGAFLWVDPAAGVACVGLGDEAFGPWARTAWPDLGQAVLEAAR
jgi:CubicO group peptidase (beta-lactamase class C family)